MAAQKSSSIGLSLALAIALHNIPEGVAVALPVYFATGSRWKGFNTAAVSGLAEPLAVVVLALLLPDKQLPYAWVEMVSGGAGAFRGCCVRGTGFLQLALQHPSPQPLHTLHRITSSLPLPPPIPPQMLAAVGGIMAFISFHELLPLAFEHAGKTRAVASTFAGMALMSFNLYFVHTFFAVE